MKPAVLFSQNCLLALVFFVGLFDVLFSEVNCNLRYLRYLYMVSCGTRKRSSDIAFNETFFRNLPLDFDEAVQYFRNNRQYNPLLIKNGLLYEILNENENTFNEEKPRTDIKIPFKTSSVILNALGKKVAKDDQGNWLGIPGFPREWGVDDLIEPGEVKFNGRRELDQLINECCKSPPNRTCNGSTFLSACK